MIRLLLALCIIFCVFSINSCKKDASTQPKVLSRSLLTAHPWKIKTLLYRAKDSADLDFTAYLYRPCELDDIYVFGSDSTFTREDNNDVCFASATHFGPWGQGNWQGNGDLTQLTIGKALSYIINFNVLELTDKSLILQEPTKDYLQNDIVYTYEFVPE